MDFFLFFRKVICDTAQDNFYNKKSALISVCFDLLGQLIIYIYLPHRSGFAGVCNRAATNYRRSRGILTGIIEYPTSCDNNKNYSYQHTENGYASTSYITTS